MPSIKLHFRVEIKYDCYTAHSSFVKVGLPKYIVPAKPIDQSSKFIKLVKSMSEALLEGPRRPA